MKEAQQQTSIDQIAIESKPKTQRRLRSTAPIYALMDKIIENHPDDIKSINSEGYTCKCGVVFVTTSYRERNFKNHLKTHLRLCKKNPWSVAKRSAIASTKPTPTIQKQPTNICQGFYLREVDGVDITDRYHVKAEGKEGFYGVPNHRSYVDGELRGTYKSIFCLLTGKHMITSTCKSFTCLYQVT